MATGSSWAGSRYLASAARVAAQPDILDNHLLVPPLLLLLLPPAAQGAWRQWCRHRLTGGSSSSRSPRRCGWLEAGCWSGLGWRCSRHQVATGDRGDGRLRRPGRRCRRAQVHDLEPAAKATAAAVHISHDKFEAGFGRFLGTRTKG